MGLIPGDGRSWFPASLNTVFTGLHIGNELSDAIIGIHDLFSISNPVYITCSIGFMNFSPLWLMTW